MKLRRSFAGPRRFLTLCFADFPRRGSTRTRGAGHLVELRCGGAPHRGGRDQLDPPRSAPDRARGGFGVPTLRLHRVRGKVEGQEHGGGARRVPARRAPMRGDRAALARVLRAIARAGTAGSALYREGWRRSQHQRRRRLAPHEAWRRLATVAGIGEDVCIPGRCSHRVASAGSPDPWRCAMPRRLSVLLTACLALLPAIASGHRTTEPPHQLYRMGDLSSRATRSSRTSRSRTSRTGS
jgi:hypothetical protein